MSDLKQPNPDEFVESVATGGTGGDPMNELIAELLRLRALATPEHWQHDETHAEIYATNYGVIASFKGMSKRCTENRNAELAIFAANHAVEIAEYVKELESQLAKERSDYKQIVDDTAVAEALLAEIEKRNPLP